MRRVLLRRSCARMCEGLARVARSGDDGGMGFSTDMSQAASRQLAAADKLDGDQKRPVAAYLYGLAAECAVKAMLKSLRVKEPSDGGNHGPYYAHFPKLRSDLEAVVQGLQGRGARVLEPFTKNSFLRDWDIVVRYARSDELVGSHQGRAARYDKWKKDAKHAVAAMGEL